MREYKKYDGVIPKIKFPTNWEILLIRPFIGNELRFRVYDGFGEVSVYLDLFDELGSVGEAYWEIYCEDTERFLIDDIDGLLEGITEMLKLQKKINSI